MSATTAAVYDVGARRADFPILERQVHGHPLVYLDNAATTQKPRSVIASLVHFYEQINANVHRGVHTLSQQATAAVEDSRAAVARFLNAASPSEVVFTRGTTEAINLVAYSFGRRLHAGDEVILTQMEHHSNIVPWQLLAQRSGVVLRVAPVNDDGSLDLGAWQALFGPRTRLAAFVHVSNALGTVNPVADMVAFAHDRGVPALVDGAQAVAHERVDLQALAADFYAFSGHKLYGPTGVGALVAKRRWLEEMEPWQGGGDMIRSVSFAGSTWNDVPHKFEAGTPNIADIVALKAALDYVVAIGFDAIAAHERELLEYGTELLAAMPDVRLIGTAPRKAGVLSFVVAGIHPHDVGTVLDHEGVAVRAGHHCTQPLMERFGVPATTRASFALYNTRGEVEALAHAVAKAIRMFS